MTDQAQGSPSEENTERVEGSESVGQVGLGINGLGLSSPAGQTQEGSEDVTSGTYESAEVVGDLSMELNRVADSRPQLLYCLRQCRSSCHPLRR